MTDSSGSQRLAEHRSRWIDACEPLPDRQTIDHAILALVNLRAPRPDGRFSLALLAVLGLVVAGSVSMLIHGNATSGPALVVGADGSAAGTLGLVGAKKYRSAYFGRMCVSEPGEITIRSIEPLEPRGGLQVTDFSIVLGKDDGTAILGASSGHLRDEPSYRGVKTVTATCPSGHYADLFVELYKPRSEDASAREFTVKYDSDGDHRNTKLRYGFGLCKKDGCDVL